MPNVSAKPKDLKRLESIAFKIELKSKFLHNLREYFFSKEFIEVTTPVMIKSPAPENHINAPVVKNLFLRSSPELHMKRMVGAGYKKIFQIGPCFRENEEGLLHNPEFTMLEWYETGKNYMDLAEFLKEMLTFAIKATLGDPKVKFKNGIIDFEKKWEPITVHEAFKKYTNMTPEIAIEHDVFEILLTEKIEPNLPNDRPVILKDYPIKMAALSRPKKDNPNLAERWELYLGGIEIANTYSELIDPVEQKKRFDEVLKLRAGQKLPTYPIDREFFNAMSFGMPDFAGSALGIDRLIMIITNSENIMEVMPFKK